MFCQNAVESSMCDHEVLLNNKIQSEKMMQERLQDLFVELDEMNQSEESPPGVFTFEELVSSVHIPRFQAKFAVLGIEPEDAFSLFKLLDKSGDGIIDGDEFVSGCLRLRGMATRLDVEMLSYSFEFHMKKLDKFMEHVTERLGQVQLIGTQRKSVA